jgi:iron complex transport system ATP-binding protein
MNPSRAWTPGTRSRRWNTFEALARDGKSVLVSLHDLGLAARHCSRLILMDRGRIVAAGPPEDVLSERRLADVFGIRAHLSLGVDGLVFQPLSVIG